MKRKTLLCAVLACAFGPAAATPAPDAPAPAPSPFSGADQKLVDRYMSALRDKYGLSAAAVEDGKLAVTPAGRDKAFVDVKDAKSEDDLEARLLEVLKPAKLEAGEKKTPVYFVGTTAEDLFKGAVAGADGDAAAAAAKADGNDYKALLDLKQAKILFPTKTQPEIALNADGKPARRVIVRKAADGTLVATLDGDAYSFAVARVKADKSERDPQKTANASPFFELDAWLRARIKAADAEAAREEKMKYPKLTDAGYRHPAFEKLMSQVQGKLSADGLDKAFDAAGDHSPADLQARAQAAKELASTGYGEGAHWKINSNGKYAAPDGTMTLLVRPNGATGHNGNIDEVAVTVTKNAKGQWDLSSAADKVADILIHGKVADAKAAALKEAATPTVAQAADELERKPVAVVSPGGALGFVAPTAKDRAPDVQPVPVLSRTHGRLADEHADAGVDPETGLRGVPPEMKLRGDLPEARLRGVVDTTPHIRDGGIHTLDAAPQIRDGGIHDLAHIADAHGPCVVPQEGQIAARFRENAAGPLPDWMAMRPGFVGSTASVLVCHESNLMSEREIEDAVQDMALKSLGAMRNCPSVSKAPRIVGVGRVPQKNGKRASACARAQVDIDG